jgi:Domain of unknown function (DUF4262)
MARGIGNYIRRGQAIVRRYGWMVQAVLADQRQPTYSYSVGFSKIYGHPEIFIVGFHPDMCRSLINVAGNHIAKGLRFDAPMLSDGIIEDFPVAFRPLRLSSVSEHSNAGRAILGRSFPGTQLFLPDPGGRFPWEPGCDPRYAAIQTSLLETMGDPSIW